MPLFREDSEFADSITEAARRLRLTRAFVEKDYWVTQVLRTLRLLFPGGFLVKGGTSLSKGYAIIDRFSEDVDILVVRYADHSATSAATRLLGMTAGVAGALGLAWETARDPGRGVEASRGDFLRYPVTEQDPGLDTGIRTDGVLLETGFTGGQEPSEMCRVTTLVGSALRIAPEEYDDLAPFDLRMLEPKRTLIGKCFALHHLASTWTEEDPPTEARFGRHYYDVYKLLGSQSTLRRLGDREGFNAVVEDVARISRNHFGVVTTRPAEGFGQSVAFRPEPDSHLRAWLQAGYERSLRLLSSTASPPSFGQVLARVAQHAELL